MMLLAEGRRWALGVLLIALVALGAACSAPTAEDRLRDEMRDEMREAGLSDELVDCVVEAFADAGLAADDLDNAALPSDAASTACVGQMFEEMFGAAFEEAFSELGTEDWEPTLGGGENREDLSELADACRNGDNAACDDLWLASPIDSPEEALAESCGGRSDELRQGSCEFWLD